MSSTPNSKPQALATREWQNLEIQLRSLHEDPDRFATAVNRGGMQRGPPMFVHDHDVGLLRTKYD